jgi:hypothetical protein
MCKFTNYSLRNSHAIFVTVHFSVHANTLSFPLRPSTQPAFFISSTLPRNHTFIHSFKEPFHHQTNTFYNSSTSPCVHVCLQFPTLTQSLRRCHMVPCRSHNILSSSHSCVLKSATLSISLSSKLFILSKHLSI